MVEHIMHHQYFGELWWQLYLMLIIFCVLDMSAYQTVFQLVIYLTFQVYILNWSTVWTKIEIKDGLVEWISYFV